jgi:small subunit ribosomal protein S2
MVEAKETAKKKVAKKEGEKPKEKVVKKTAKKKTVNKAEEKKVLEKAEEQKEVQEVEEISLEERKKALLEKAKKLRAKVEDIKAEDLKEQIKLKKRTDMLIPLEDYVKSGIYLGTKAVTPKMKKYVYRRRADGLAIFNTDIIDEKLKEGINYISKFEPEDIILVCKRKAGWKPAEMLSKFTGIRIFTTKYPAGILTNTTLPNFFENELTIVCDSWLDKNSLQDTLKVNKKVLMVCDTNNFPSGASQIVIGNNKSPKSLGVIFYLLAKGYCKARKIDVELPDIEKWTGEE